MFKKYLHLWSGIVAGCCIVFFAISIISFSHLLRSFQTATEERMISAVKVISDYIEQARITYEELSENKSLHSWLMNFIQGAGFERIVITDTVPVVRWSSHEYIKIGENYVPYLVDETLFRKSLSEQRYLFSPITTISGVHFKSLFSYCSISGRPSVIIVELDHHFLRDGLRLKTVLLLFSGIFTLLCAGMLFLLFFMDKRLHAEYVRATRNERLAFLGRTSAELAHELKNPLAIIKTGLDALRLRYNPDKSDTTFVSISDEIMRVSGMIGDILCFSRERKLACTLFAPCPVISEAEHTICKQYPAITTKNTVDPALRLRGDAGAFRQITDNLFRNACTAMGFTGTITVSSAYEGTTCMLLFSDTGQGIDETQTRHIFDPFVSGSKAGTGLGLAIVKTLCDAMGWRVELQSSRKGETIFAVLLKEGAWEKS